MYVQYILHKTKHVAKHALFIYTYRCLNMMIWRLPRSMNSVRILMGKHSDLYIR